MAIILCRTKKEQQKNREVGIYIVVTGGEIGVVEGYEKERRRDLRGRYT